uniref:ULP_PROTEASE domain-containing protein n=1 Tax=Steinernema glaseri TaxID=37863 RepID=A0A1I8AFV8_9BILA
MKTTATTTTTSTTRMLTTAAHHETPTTMTKPMRPTTRTAPKPMPENISKHSERTNANRVLLGKAMRPRTPPRITPMTTATARVHPGSARASQGSERAPTGCESQSGSASRTRAPKFSMTIWNTKLKKENESRWREKSTMMTPRRVEAIKLDGAYDRREGREGMGQGQIFVPIIYDEHWRLASFEVHEKTIRYYDTQAGPLTLELERRLLAIARALSCDATSVVCMPTSFFHHQIDGYNCGVYMLMLIERITYVFC